MTDMSVAGWLVMAMCMGVYAVGAYVILKWVCQRTVMGYWRLRLRRVHGVPVLWLEDVDDECDDWRP